MVLRVKTDIEHKNPALRDWVAFRMIDTPHPREAADYRAWPMLDFQSGVDDHLTGITHIIRGIDLQDSAKRQQFVYDYFGWDYPEVVHWGHVQVDAYDVTLSTSSIDERIDAASWRAGTTRARRPSPASTPRHPRRGRRRRDGRLGTSTSNVDLAMSSSTRTTATSSTTTRTGRSSSGTATTTVASLSARSSAGRTPANRRCTRTTRSVAAARFR